MFSLKKIYDLIFKKQAVNKIIFSIRVEIALFFFFLNPNVKQQQSIFCKCALLFVKPIKIILR